MRTRWRLYTESRPGSNFELPDPEADAWGPARLPRTCGWRPDDLAGLATECRRCYLDQPMGQIDWFPLILSIRIALIATALVVLIGVALGWVLARKSFWGRELLDAVVTLPLVLPPTVLGYYLL